MDGTIFMKNRKFLILLLTLLTLILCAACTEQKEKFTTTYQTLDGGIVVTVKDGDVRTVTAVPNEGYEFIEWSDGVLTETRQESNVQSDITATAVFKKKICSLQYYADKYGVLEGEDLQTVEYGGTATSVTAVPNEGYVFVKWSDGVETATRSDQNIKFNLNVTALFERARYAVNYMTNGNGGVLSGKSNQTIAYNESATTISALPNKGYRFVKWSDGLETASRKDKGIKSDFSVVAIFEKITFRVWYETSNGGLVQGTRIQTVKYDESASTVTAVPNEGYHFVKWSDGVETNIRTDECVKENIKVTAIFGIEKYTLSYTTDGNGVLDGEENQVVEYGKHATSVTAIPNEGYEFVKWSDGVTWQTRADRNVGQDVSVTACFRKLSFKVIYLASHSGLGMVNEESEIHFTAEYGDVLPTIEAMPLQDYYGVFFAFLGWSDGVTTKKRTDKVTSSFCVTALFAYKVEYKVDNNEGGTIEGEIYQTLLASEISTKKFREVRAVPHEGYAFVGWSDLTFEATRQDKINSDDKIKYNWEYVAYFEPIEKKFQYNYGLAGGSPLPTKIVINRYSIRDTDFIVPKSEGYRFCGWYADQEYKIKVANEKGKYMYGYAAFALETDTLYAKWQKADDKSDNHKVLLVFVDEVNTELFEGDRGMLDVQAKMNPLDYRMSEWVAKTFSDLLTDWFQGEVIFEVDSYYTTTTVTDGFEHYFDYGQHTYALFAESMSEVCDLIYDYHNIITLVHLGEHSHSLQAGGGISGDRHACVFRDEYWNSYGSVGLDRRMAHKIYESLPRDLNLHDLNVTIIDTLFHEFAHTMETQCGILNECGGPTDKYDLHTVLHYAYCNDELKFTLYTSLPAIKSFLLGEFDLDGTVCGVPKEYWEHKFDTRVLYLVAPANSYPGVVIEMGVSEIPKNPTALDLAYGKRGPYGFEITVEAVPFEGYRFVKWSDGITTAIRHDKVIAYVELKAIFEKI